MRFLVASFHHHLIPLHHRLRREGFESEALVWHHRYERAWDGLVDKRIRRSQGGLTEERLKEDIEAARAGELVLVSDVRKLSEWFSGAPRLFTPGPELGPEPSDRMLFGAWFDGEHLRAPHLLIADWGVWPGGLGPHAMGGLCLVRLAGNPPSFLEPVLLQVTQELSTKGFRGLVQFDVEEEAATGQFRLRGLRSGWNFLHTHAFVAELENLGAMLQGEAPRLSKKYVQVVPVSVPPWPNSRTGDGDQVAVRGLTEMQQGRCFWFDVVVQKERRQILTGGLDGLVCIATGASDSSSMLARLKAQEIPARLELPQKQYRPDAGMGTEAALATLEERWGVTI